MIVVQVDLYLLPLSISGLEMQMENAFSSNCAIWLAYFIIIDFTILRSSSKCGNHCIQINKIHSCFAIFFRQIFDFEHQIYRIHISTEFSLVEKKNELLKCLYYLWTKRISRSFAYTLSLPIDFMRRPTESEFPMTEMIERIKDKMKNDRKFVINTHTASQPTKLCALSHLSLPNALQKAKNMHF